MGKPPKPPEKRAKIASGVLLVDEPDYRVPLDEGAPRPKPATGKPLDEVERALSVLDGRHPDAVRVERETQAALAQKKAKADARARSERSVQRRRRLRRAGVALAVSVPVAATALVSARIMARANAVARSLAPRLEPFTAQGFVRVGGARLAQETIDLETAEPACYVALASRDPGDGALVVERPAGRLEADTSIGWCTCGAEAATVHLKDRGSGTAGLAVVRASGVDVGGALALAFLEPRPGLLAPASDCDPATFDAWTEKRPAARADDHALDEELRAALIRSGFTIVGSAPPLLPFAVVPMAPDTCALALSTSPRDLLGLRLHGGVRPIEGVSGPIGLCASHGGNVTIWRDGPGELVVTRVAASRIGGTHGLRDAMPRLGLPSVSAWVAEDDLAWDATAALRSIGVLSAEIAAVDDGKPVKDARVIALSIAGATVLSDGDGAAASPGRAPSPRYACDAPLTTTTRSAVCLQSAELPWRAVGSAGRAGIAEGPFPFWMEGLAGATEPRALTTGILVLKLGQRLLADGFEASLRDGVIETEGGVRLQGRGGSDGLVAIQLSRGAPWVSACRSDGGEAWSVDGLPGVVSLAANAETSLVCEPRAAHEHRTVLFRRSVKPGPR